MRTYQQVSRTKAKDPMEDHSTTKMPELKFAPQGNTRMPTATYNSVKEAVISYIQKTYKNGQDVTKSLKEMNDCGLITLMSQPSRWQPLAAGQETVLKLETTSSIRKNFAKVYGAQRVCSRKD